MSEYLYYEDDLGELDRVESHRQPPEARRGGQVKEGQRIKVG